MSGVIEHTVAGDAEAIAPPTSESSAGLSFAIVHFGDEIQLVERLVAELSPVQKALVINGLEEIDGDGRPRTIYNLASRITVNSPVLRDCDRLVLIGAGRFGGILTRALASELLGRDKTVEAILLVEDVAQGRKISRDLGIERSLEWSEPIVVWSEAEDLQRIRSHQAQSPSSCGKWLREQIEDICSRAPAVSAKPTFLNLRSSRPDRSRAVCIPGAGASVVSLLELAQAAPESVGVYAIQPRGLDGLTPPYATVDAAASAILPYVADLANEGPLHLVGHSYGGCIAFELACRLVDCGIIPSSVSLIDTRSPRSTPYCDDITDFDLLLHWIGLNELAIERPMGVSQEDFRTGDLFYNLAVLHRAMVGVGLLPVQTVPRDLLGPLRMFAHCVRNWYHTARVYTGSLQLIYLDDPTLDRAGNSHLMGAMRSGWQERAAQLQFRHAAGNHLTGLKMPHVTRLSSLLNWGA